MIYSVFLNKHLLDARFYVEYFVTSYNLNFVVDDERISKQGQCHNPVGCWS
jgi:hypothetical protein